MNTQAPVCCPKCSSETALHFSTRCLHALCQQCLSSFYTQAGLQRKCYSCQTVLLRKDYVQKDPEIYLVEKETEIRKQVLKIYNLRRNDFATAEEYDEYLETIEDLIFVLVDQDATEAEKQQVRDKMKKEKIKNAQKIAN